METEKNLMTDLDNTLLKESKHIAGKDGRFIQEIAKKISFGLVTGRSIMIPACSRRMTKVFSMVTEAPQAKYKLIL